MQNQNAHRDKSAAPQNILLRTNSSNRGVPSDRYEILKISVRIEEPNNWRDKEKMQNPIEK